MKGIIKFFKFIWWTAIILVLLVVAAVLTLPLWIEPVATGAANVVVPDIVKTDFKLNEFGLNQYVGTLHVGDMTLANPTNFDKANCVELGKLDVRVKPLSVFTKKIHVENITLDGLLIAATAGFGNFMQLAENVQGEKPDVTVPETAPEGTPEAGEGRPEAVEEAEAEVAKATKDAPKVQIDKLVIKNVTVKIGVVPIPLPTITIEGIGADKPEGASLSDAFEAICNKVMESADALGGALGTLGTAALDAGSEAMNAALDAGAEAANAALSAGSEAAAAVTETASEVLSGAGDAAGAAVDSVMDVGGSAVDTVSEGAGKAVDAVSEGAGKAVDAVKDVGGAAVDSIKGLFQ